MKNTLQLFLVFSRFIVTITLVSYINHNEKKTVSSQKEIKVESVKANTNKKQSFTVSCGSGSAMIYNEVNTKISDSLQIIEFKVTMYVNETISDEYVETYEIVCGESGLPNSVKLKGENENLLQNQQSLLREDLKRISLSKCSMR